MTLQWATSIAFCVAPCLASAVQPPAAVVQFEENVGQTDARVEYLARGGSLTAFLTRGDAVLAFGNSILRMRVLHAAEGTRAQAIGELRSKVHYLDGRAITDVRTFSGVRYRGIGPGIDLVYYGVGSEFEYDVEVAPHADPGAMRFSLDGADSVMITASGELDVQVGKESVRFRRPVAYQMKNGSRLSVDARYVVSGRTIWFETGAYDREQPLVIDPVVTYSSYSGYAAAESGATRVAFDAAGNLYVAGHARSSTFPQASGANVLAAGDQVLFVTKLAASDRRVLYTTFVAPNASPLALGVDSTGSVTLSVGRPCLAATGGVYDAIAGVPSPGTFGYLACVSIIRLNPTGTSIAWTARVGFEGPVHVQADGSVVIVGDNRRDCTFVCPTYTFSATAGAVQEAPGGGTDLFILKLNSTGTLAWASYYGGAGTDRQYGSGLDGSGNVWIAGQTSDTAFPTTGAALPTASIVGTCASSYAGVCGFILGINSTGNGRIASRLLPGFSPWGAMTTSPGGRVAIAGRADSTFQLTANAYLKSRPPANLSQSMVSIADNGNTLETATYVEEVPSILVSDASGVYVMLSTSNPYMPVVSPFQAGLGGLTDVWVSKFDPSMSTRAWSSFFGAAGDETLTGAATSGTEIAFSGRTTSPNLPTTSNALQSTKDNNTAYFTAAVNTSSTPNCVAAAGTIATEYPAGAGDITVPFTLDAGCTWTASSTAAWATPTDPSSGFGSGTARIALAANQSSSPRTATLNLAGNKVDIRQAGVSCTPFQLSSKSLTAGVAPLRATLQFTAPASDCSWTAVSDAAWLTIATVASGTGSGTVEFNVAGNSGPARSGTITVGGAQFTVAQAGTCAAFVLTPNTLTADPTGGSGSFTISGSSPACAWSVISTVQWVTITSGNSGTGSGTVTFTYQANTTGASRIGAITGSGIFTITQPAVACTLTLDNSSAIIGQVGGQVEVGVTASHSSCAWTAAGTSSAITAVSPSNGTGNGRVKILVAPNFGTTGRNLTVNIAGKPFTVTQSAANCTYTLNPSTLVIPASGQTGPLTVTARGSNCAWASESDKPWVQTFPISGDAGTLTASCTVFPNFSASVRAATVHIGTTTLSVVQAGNTRTASERFVQLLYSAFFGRLPTEAEIAFQAQALEIGMPHGQMATNFFYSAEFNQGGRFIAGLYVGLLNRDAEYGGWLFQRNAVSTGVVNQLSLVSNFLNSQEFQLANSALSDESFVRLLYRQVLLREADAGEVAFQSGVLAGGGSRIVLANSFLNSQEFRIGTGPRLTAFLLYAALLQRDPSPGERALLRSQIVAGTPLIHLITGLVNSPEFNASVN